MPEFKAVFFDVGEVLVDETREYGAWADWLGVPRHTFSAMFGAVIARGQDYREVFQHFRPGFDLAAERDARAAAGRPELFGEDDLYPSTRRCLSELREEGYLVGIAGNQTARAEGILRGLDLPADFIGTSDSWHVEKPSTKFFERICVECKAAPKEVIYVGDRLDNDILPAGQVGMTTVQVKQGPWAFATWGDTGPDMRIQSLAELPPTLRQYSIS